MSVLEPRVTSIARPGFSIFSKPSYFCMCNFVSGNKARLASVPGNNVPHTKLKSAILAEIKRTQVAEFAIIYSNLLVIVPGTRVYKAVAQLYSDSSLV